MSKPAPVLLHVAAVEFTARYLLAPQLHALADAGYDVRLACQPLGDQFDPHLHRFRPIQIAFPRTADPRSVAKAGLRLTRLVRELKPDLVHFHSPAAALPGRFAMALLGPRRPLVAYTVHGFPHQWDQRSRHSSWLMSAEWLLSFVSDLLLFQSQEDYVQAQKRHFRGRLTYLGNGVGDEWFVGPQPKARHASTASSLLPNLRVVFVGRLTEEKGVLDLLEALRHTSGVDLTIVGEHLPSDRDPVATEARQFARTADLPATFVGHLEPTSVRATLMDADLFVLPSWREGLPRSVIEAMACGLPVIATDIRGCRELVTDNLTGWLVPPKNPAALATALNHAATLSARDLAAAGQAGFQRVDSEYRESQAVARLRRAYEELGLQP